MEWVKPRHIQCDTIHAVFSPLYLVSDQLVSDQLISDQLISDQLISDQLISDPSVDMSVRSARARRSSEKGQSGQLIINY